MKEQTFQEWWDRLPSTEQTNYYLAKKAWYAAKRSTHSTDHHQQWLLDKYADGPDGSWGGHP